MTSKSNLPVTITEDDINNAIRGDSSHCMIADAISRQLEGVKRVSVDLQTIAFTDPKAGKRYYYLTPRSAQIALLQFDQGMKVDPFVFRLPKSAAQVRKSGRNRTRASLQQTDRQVKTTQAPTRVGGDAPPTGPLTNRGRRRAFGLRGMSF